MREISLSKFGTDHGRMALGREGKSRVPKSKNRIDLRRKVASKMGGAAGERMADMGGNRGSADAPDRYVPVRSATEYGKGRDQVRSGKGHPFHPKKSHPNL